MKQFFGFLSINFEPNAEETEITTFVKRPGEEREVVATVRTILFLGSDDYARYMDFMKGIILAKARKVYGDVTEAGEG